MIRLVLLFVVLSIAASTSHAAENTPEETVSAFISNLGKQNLSGMITLFPISEDFADGSFKSYAVHLRKIDGVRLITNPPENFPMYKKIGENFMIAKAAKEISKLYLFLTIGERAFAKTKAETKKEIDDYVVGVNPEKLGDIAVISTARLYSKKARQQILQINRGFYDTLGIRDVDELAVLVTTGHREFMIPFRVMRYQDAWKITDINTLGAPEIVRLREISKKEFDEKIAVLKESVKIDD